jgi:hypothetical protein
MEGQTKDTGDVNLTARLHPSGSMHLGKSYPEILQRCTDRRFLKHVVFQMFDSAFPPARVPARGGVSARKSSGDCMMDIVTTVQAKYTYSTLTLFYATLLLR